MYHLNWITQPIVIQDRSMLSYMGWIVASLHHSEAGQRLDINVWSCYWQQSHGIFLNTSLEYWRMWKTSKLNKFIERTYNHEGYWKLLKIVAITQSIWLFGANSWRCTLSIMYTIGVVLLVAQQVKPGCYTRFVLWGLGDENEQSTNKSGQHHLQTLLNEVMVIDKQLKLCLFKGGIKNSCSDFLMPPNTTVLFCLRYNFSHWRKFHESYWPKFY